MKLEAETVKSFLGELTTLSEKYKIEIWGCGCCGSPTLRPLEKAGRYSVTESRYTYDDGEHIYFDDLNYSEDG